MNIQHLLALFGCIFIVVMSHHYIDHVSDDGAIFLRYAQNVLDGKGVVYNEGEYVEGYSSPLWLLLLIVCGSIVPLSFAPKILGSLLLWSSFFLLYKKLGEIQGIIVQQSFFVVTIFLGGHFYWMATGMETPLLCFLWMNIGVFWGSKRSFWALSLLGIARPEGFALVVVALFLLSKEIEDNRSILATMGWIIFPSCLWFLFRLFYYHDILPNTYYAKTGGDVFVQLQNGWLYTKHMFLVMLFLGGLQYYRYKNIYSFFLLILFDVVLIAMGGGDWMLWGRMLVPLWMCLWICVPKLEFQIQQPILFFFYGLTWWAIWPMALSLKGIQFAFQGKRLPIAGYQEGSLVEMSQEQARFLQSVLPISTEKTYRIAVNHAGFLPLYLDDYIILDMTGLNNNHIARRAGGLHQKYDVEYVLSQKPDVIVFHSPLPPISQKPFVQGEYWAGENEILKNPKFWEEYQFQKNYWQRQGQGATILYSLFAIRKSSLLDFKEF